MPLSPGQRLVVAALVGPRDEAMFHSSSPGGQSLGRSVITVGSFDEKTRRLQGNLVSGVAELLQVTTKAGEEDGEAGGLSIVQSVVVIPRVEIN